MKRPAGCCLLILLLLLAPAQAAMDNYALQWQYIKNFVKYIQWPGDGQGGDFRFCVLGPSPFGATSGRIRLKKAMLSLSIIHYEDKLPDENEMALCHLAYLGHGLDADLYFYLLNELKTRPVLTISDREQFIAQGGLMQFTRVNNKLRFIINGREAKKKGIVISPVLLRLSEKGVG